MIETISWAMIFGGLAVLVVSYARYFFGGRGIKADPSTEAEQDLVDPQASLSNVSLDPRLMERALHARLPEQQRAHAARLPAELDPIFDDLAPGVEVDAQEQFVGAAREEMMPQFDADLFEDDAAADQLSAQSYANDREITCLNVMAKPGRVLSGAALKGQLMARGFQHGEMRIFHLRFNQQTLFSVVNMVEPGYFEFDTMEAMTTPGISFFLQLPGPLRDDMAFDMMLTEAHEIAQELDAELRDENQAPLTRNMLEDTRARLIRSANARFGVHEPTQG